MTINRYSPKGAGETISNLVSVAKNSLSISSDNNKIVTGMVKGTKLVPGIMGRVNYEKAIKVISGLVNNGNYQGARDYVKEQDQKIRGQEKASSIVKRY